MSRVCMVFVLWVLAFLSCKPGGIEPTPVPIALPEDRAPSWSPDGQWITYFHFNADVNDTSYPTGLYLIDIEGKDRKLLVKGSAQNPDWSPDASRIAFDNGEIFLLDVRTGSSSQVTSHDGGAHFPTWAADGENIAYQNVFHAEDDPAGIWLLGLRDLGRRYLWLGGSPDWSPDGRFLIFEDFDGLRRARIDSSEFQLLVLEKGASDPAWSPDGSSIAWASAQAEIRIMDANGTNARKLTDGIEPAWAPDSRRLVFARRIAPGKKMVLWTIDVDGKNLKQLTF